MLIASLMLQIPTETIASVLQEHDGNVESTIEALLNVCSPAQSSKKVTILLTLNSSDTLSNSASEGYFQDLPEDWSCRACRRPHL